MFLFNKAFICTLIAVNAQENTSTDLSDDIFNQMLSNIASVEEKVEEPEIIIDEPENTVTEIDYSEYSSEPEIEENPESNIQEIEEKTENIIEKIDYSEFEGPEDTPEILNDFVPISDVREYEEPKYDSEVEEVEKIPKKIEEIDNVVEEDTPEMSNDYVPIPDDYYEEEEEEGILDYNVDVDYLASLGLDIDYVNSLVDAATAAATTEEDAAPAEGPLEEESRFSMLDVLGPINSNPGFPEEFNGPNSESGRVNNDQGLDVDVVNSCYTCEASGSDATTVIANCLANGSIKQCDENSMCMIELRKRNGAFTGFRTGCKQREACLNQQKQNFGPGPLMMQQCRPEHNLQTSRFGPSVCRQCFQTCYGSGDHMNECFTPANGIPIDVGTSPTAPHYYDFLTQHDSCTTTNCPAYGRSWWDAALDKCQDAQFLETLGACTNTDARFTPQYSGYKMGTEHRN